LHLVAPPVPPQFRLVHHQFAPPVTRLIPRLVPRHCSSHLSSAPAVPHHDSRATGYAAVPPQFRATGSAVRSSPQFRAVPPQFHATVPRHQFRARSSATVPPGSAPQFRHQFTPGSRLVHAAVPHTVPHLHTVPRRSSAQFRRSCAVLIHAAVPHRFTTSSAWFRTAVPRHQLRAVPRRSSTPQFRRSSAAWFTPQFRTTGFTQTVPHSFHCHGSAPDSATVPPQFRAAVPR
jgi:hypothetical protein